MHGTSSRDQLPSFYQNSDVLSSKLKTHILLTYYSRRALVIKTCECICDINIKSNTKLPLKMYFSLYIIDIDVKQIYENISFRNGKCLSLEIHSACPWPECWAGFSSFKWIWKIRKGHKILDRSDLDLWPNLGCDF